MSRISSFPALRMRRLRRHDWTRRLVAETTLAPADFIWPLFVIDGQARREPVASMPGVDRLSVDLIAEAAQEAQSLGIPAVALFPADRPAAEDRRTGAKATNPDNLVCRAVRAIKQAAPGIGVMCDVALDPYTDHGHDGVIVDGYVANDETVEILVRQALVQVEAGCDIVAPSDMMDGRIGRHPRGAGNRRAQEHADHGLCGQICLRLLRAVPRCRGLGQGAGRRQAHLPDGPANSDEALREVALDLAEGADMVMVKPGMPYLDVVQRVKAEFQVPTFAYQVSGEYAMLMAAIQNGWLERDRVMLESLLAFKRAGASGILTYFARDAARLLSAP